MLWQDSQLGHCCYDCANLQAVDGAKDFEFQDPGLCTTWSTFLAVSFLDKQFGNSETQVIRNKVATAMAPLHRVTVMI